MTTIELPGDSLTVDGTVVTYGDLLMIGTHVLNLLSASKAMGHNGPHASLVYIPSMPDQDWCRRLVLDIFEMDSFTTDDEKYQAARDRVHAFLADSGWDRRCAEFAGTVGT